LLIPFGCDALTETPVPSAPRDAGSEASGSDSAGAPPIFFPPVDLGLAGSSAGPIDEPVPSSEWCAEAARHGAVFCEAGGQDLEFCEVAKGESSEASGGAESSAGVCAGGATHAGDADVGGASGGGGVGGEGAALEAPERGCVVPEPTAPPYWVYELLIQCEGQCSVWIWPSPRRIDGACCYLARGVFGGR
jgi:hypothetical protein